MTNHMILLMLFVAPTLKASDIYARIFGLTPLLMAIFDGLEDHADKLLDQGADPNLATERSTGYVYGTPANHQVHQLCKGTHHKRQS